jgi:hypothetical protein
MTGDGRLERLGEELGPDSPVWRIFNNVARVHDKEFVEGWDKSLDVLLIFVRLPQDRGAIADRRLLCRRVCSPLWSLPL